MPPAEAFAYPVMLLAIYAMYRIGKLRERPHLNAFEWIRICTLAMFMGALAGIEVRLAQDGVFSRPIPFLAGVLSIAAVVGLVGLNVLDWLEAFENTLRGRWVPPSRES